MKIRSRIMWIDIYAALVKGRTPPKKVKYQNAEKKLEALIFCEKDMEYKTKDGSIFHVPLKHLSDIVDVVKW